MQIEDGRIIGWLWWIITSILGAIVFLVGFIYNRDRGQINKDRERIVKLEEIASDLETKMSHAVTMKEVEYVAGKLKAEFKDDHHELDAKLLRLDDKLERVEDGLKREITESHDSLQGSINGIYNILTRPYAGQDRRKN